MVTPKRVGHLAVQGGRSCLHTDAAIQLTSRLLERHQNPWWPLWYHWRPVGWTTLRCLATSHTYLLWQIEVNSMNPWFQGSHHYLVWGTVDICCEQPTEKGRNVQRLPVPRLHPKQGCQAQIVNQTDKGRILQDRRLPLSSPKGQNHLG